MEKLQKANAYFTTNHPESAEMSQVVGFILYSIKEEFWA